MAGRYDRLLSGLTPCSLDEQIKAVVQHIEMTSAYLDRRIARGEMHPHLKGQRLHGLRSVLLTLQALREQSAGTPAPHAAATAALEHHA